MNRNYRALVWLILMILLWYCTVPLQALTIEQALREEDPDHLATVSQIQGDAKRGAILFYQSYLACTKCHLENLFCFLITGSCDQIQDERSRE